MVLNFISPHSVCISKLSCCLHFCLCAFFSRRHRRWIILWTVRLMAHRRSWMIKMRPQPVRWAGWPPSKTGRGSWSQHRPLPAEFWWDGHTQTPTKASLNAHKLSHILPQSHSEHLTLIFIHFYQVYVFSLITWIWCLTKQNLLHAMTQLAHCWWHFLFLYVSVRSYSSHTSDSRGQDYTQMIYGCFVKYGLISMPHTIKGFWERSNTERWLVWVALIIITVVSACIVLDMDRSINYEQLSQFTT